jgi:hypothetical protein
VTHGLEKGAASRAFAVLREALPAEDRERALFRVRILRESKRPEAVRELTAIALDAAVSEAVVRAAASALALYPGKESFETLLHLWERDPDRYGAHAKHLLSKLAAKPLADRAQARAWLEQQR